MYRYLMKYRPPGPGAQPNDVKEVYSFSKPVRVWGVLCYGRQLTPKEIEDFELVEII